MISRKHNFSYHIKKDYLTKTVNYESCRKTEKWAGTDVEQRFNKNLSKYPKNPSLNYYLKNPIDYYYNNYGYRGYEEFKEGAEANVFLGCSYTVGIGQPLEDTWSYLVNKKLPDTNMFVNLAQGGHGIENQFRQLYRWKDYFNIKNIFHYQPIYAREELLGNEDSHGFLLTLPPDTWKKNVDKNFGLEYFASDVHIARKYVTNILAIQSIAQQLGAEYYFKHEIPQKKYRPDIREARDLMHFDVQQNIDLADDFYNSWRIKDNYIDLIHGDIDIPPKTFL